MNADIVESVSQAFINREKKLLCTHTASYAEETLLRVRIKPTAQTFRTCIITTELNRGAPALLGLVATATLLKHWQESCNNGTWFESQLTNMEDLGNNKLRGYVIPFLSVPLIGIREVMRHLDKNSPIKDFILYCDQRYPTFSIGASLMIGLLLFLDNFQFDEDVMVLQE